MKKQIVTHVTIPFKDLEAKLCTELKEATKAAYEQGIADGHRNVNIVLRHSKDLESALKMAECVQTFCRGQSFCDHCGFVVKNSEGVKCALSGLPYEWFGGSDYGTR